MSLHKPSLYPSLPLNFSENVFYLENSLQINLTKATIDSLITCYTLGIEYYSSIGNLETVNCYQEKLTSLFLLISKEKKQINMSHMELYSLPKKVQETVSLFHNSLDSFCDLVNQNLKLQETEFSKDKIKLKRKFKRRSTFNSNEKKPSSITSTNKSSKFNTNYNSNDDIIYTDIINTNRTQDKKQTLLISNQQLRQSFKKRKPIDINTNALNSLNHDCNETYYNKLQLLIKDLAELNKAKIKKHIEYYSSLKEYELLIEDNDNTEFKENISKMISDLHKESKKDLSDIDKAIQDNINHNCQLEKIDPNINSNEINQKIIKNILDIVTN